MKEIGNLGFVTDLYLNGTMWREIRSARDVGTDQSCKRARW
jgi:hypothetical protein